LHHDSLLIFNRRYCNDLTASSHAYELTMILPESFIQLACFSHCRVLFIRRCCYYRCQVCVCVCVCVCINSCSLFSTHDCSISGSAGVQAQSSASTASHWPLTHTHTQSRAAVLNQVSENTLPCQDIPLCPLQHTMSSTRFLSGSFSSHDCVGSWCCPTVMMKPVARS